MQINVSSRRLLLVFLIFVIPHTLFAGVILFNNSDASVLMQEDARRYYERSVNLIGENFDFKKGFRRDTIWDVPLYPLFLAFCFKIAGPSYLLAVFLNIFLFGLSSSVLYIMGTLLFGNRTALFGSIIFSFYPSLLMYSLYPIAEGLFLFLLLSTFCNFNLFLKSNKIIYLIISAILAGLSTLTKEIALFIPVIMAIFLIPGYANRRTTPLKTIFLLTVIYTTVLLSQPVYNYFKFGHFTISAKTSLYRSVLNRRLEAGFSRHCLRVAGSRFAGHGNDKGFQCHPERAERVEGSKTRARNGTLAHTGMTKVWKYFDKRKHFFWGTGTIGMLRAFGYDVSELQLAGERKSFIAALKKLGTQWVFFQYLAWCFTGFVYASSFVSLFYLLIRKQFIRVAFLLSSIVYFLIISELLFANNHTRYFIPLIPLLSLLAAYPASIIYNKG